MTRRRTGSLPVWLQVLDGPLAGKMVMGDARTLPKKPGDRFTVTELAAEPHAGQIEVHEFEMVDAAAFKVRWIQVVERHPLPALHGTPGPRLDATD